METDKNEVRTEHLVEAIAYLLRETFEGSREGQASAYLDRGTGFFNTLDAITAERASRNARSYGLTARRREKPKFAMARAEAPMFRGLRVATSTTRRLAFEWGSIPLS